MHSLNVLVVDDDALVLMNTAMMVEDLGHQVAEADSVRQALVALEQNSFDVVVTDYAMPEFTGVDLIRKLLESYPRVPYVMATGYAELPVDSPPIPLKLAKPFSVSQLAEALEAACLGRTISS